MMKKTWVMMAALLGWGVFVQADPWFVRNGGDDAGDGQSWGTAWATIGKALSVAASGETVLVSNGAYLVTAELALTNGVTLTGIGGSLQTVVARTGTGNHRIFRIAHAAAVLDGFTVSNGCVTGTAPANYGCGIYMSTGGMVRNCRIVGNSALHGASALGGGIYLAGGVVSNCVVWSNGVYVGTGSNLVSQGGGIYMTGGQIVDSVIASNLAYNHGYGIYMTSGLVDRCRVTGNFSDNRGYYGGGIVMWTTGAVVRNSMINKNAGVRTVGGVFMNQGLLENCTVIGNTAGSHTGGIYATNTAVVRNTIMALNEAPPLCRDYSPGSGSYQYCCASPAPPGEGNTDLDPQLANGPAGDYRLMPGSPCLNAGTNLPWMAAARDVAGQTRLPDARVDMGALESAPDSLAVNPVASAVRAFAPADIVFTAYAAGTNTAGLTYYWDFNGDGTLDLAGAAAVVTSRYAAGMYSVMLAATNAVGEGAFVSKTNYIKIAPVELFVATNGSALFPYTNWATASTNIQRAVDAAINGSTVRVTDGVFLVAGTISLVEGVTLRSENGDIKTVVTTSGGGFGCQLAHANAVVDGFTFNKRGSGSGGVRITQLGTVRNCRIVGNRQETEAPVTLDGGGYMTDCWIITNSSRYWGSVRLANQSGGGFSALGRLENCVVLSNMQNHASYTVKSYIGGIRADSYSRVRNCVAAYNLSFGPDGGAYLDGATMENCTIVGNIASNNVDATSAGVRLVNKAVVRNTIMWANTNSVTGTGLNWTRESGTIEFNCATPDIGTNGPGNIAGPPAFLNAAAGDFRLAAGSPGANQGTNVEWMAAATDLAGLPRIGQKRVDMGAYERPTVLSGSFMIVR